MDNNIHPAVIEAIANRISHLSRDVEKLARYIRNYLSPDVVGEVWEAERILFAVAKWLKNKNAG